MGKKLREGEFLPDKAPSLKRWLEDILPKDAGYHLSKGRIRLHTGTFSYRYMDQGLLAHIHGSLRFSHGQVTYRSKHVTDAVMAGTVARAVKTQGDWDVYIRIKNRRHRKRPEKPDVPVETPAGTAVPLPGMGYITIPDGIDEELPFN